MSPQFNSMNELTSYLDTLEKRVKMLEDLNENLSQSVIKVEEASTGVLPRTSLLSRNYFKRAFTVWGHYIVASLIIALAISILAVTILLAAGFFPSITPYINSLLGR
jgi:hypothetical protein